MADFVTIKSVGTTAEQLVADLTRDLKGSMRKTARQVANDGTKAFKKAAGVKSFAGYPLKFRAKKVTANPTHALVEFQASPVGFWVILESGAQPHKIRPRNKEALAFGKYPVEEVDHPGCAGKGSFTKGKNAAVEIMDELIADTVGDAIGAR